MSDRYPGGLITKTPVVPTTSSAPGIWTLEQATYYIAQGTWPLQPPPADPYYEYVTMLLTGNGTNGAQNNTFLDSSTNAFSITRNGNTTQGSFSPYGSNWSNYFDGSNSYLTLASNSAFDLGSSDFTIEAWCYPQSTSNGIVITRAANGSTYPTFELTIYSGTWRFFSSDTSSHYNVSLNSGIAPVLNSWQHIAVTRNGSTYTIWIDGVSAATTTSSASLYANSNTVGIGAYPNNTNKYTGYISNLRLVSGTAVYTSAFTPSTTPLTAISGTQLLTCQSNRFIDNSSNAFALTVNGTPSVQAFSPFAPTAPYSTSTVGGSGYFDGSGDYLNGPNASGGDFGSGDFTISFWFYKTASGNTGGVAYADETGWNGWQVNIDTSTISWQFLNSGGGTATITAGSYKLNCWNYVVVTRSGSTITLYLNGTSIGTASDSGSYGSSTSKVRIGIDRDVAYFTGYISDVKLVKQANTPSSNPTSPATNTTNTSLLCNFTNAGIPDYAMMNDLETVGNAQVSTSVKKFGTGSLYFDGTDDYLVTASKPTTSLEGDFTIEMWIYRQTGNNYFFSVGDTSTSAGIEVYIGSSGTALNLYSNAGVRITTSPFSATTWTHLAVVRSGSTVTMYVNGTSAGTWSSSATFSGPVYVGAEYYGGSVTGTMNGYIDDLRITKGYARYTANFTPPTAAFPTY